MFLTVAALHGLLLLNLAKSLRPPSTIGDGSSDDIAMTVSLVPSSTVETPQSDGADQETKATASPTSEPTSSKDEAKEAEGAGTKVATISGGSHTQDHAQAAQVTTAGGGGGTKDDPYARASLRPSLDLTNTFDLVARNDALFLSRVKPCLDQAGVMAPNVVVAVSLDDKGFVTAATPVRQGGPPGPPNTTESQVIAALKACAPYRDIVLGRSPVLKMPNSQAALAPGAAKPGL